MRMFFIVLFLISFMANCTSKNSITLRNQLSEQILTLRPGGKAVLSNMSWDYGSEPYTKNSVWGSHLAEYDLADETIRKALFEFRFICNIGGKLYKVCADKPGFCRVYFEPRKNWFSSRTQKEEYINIVEKYQFLVQARTTCFSQLRREFDEVD